MCVWEVLAPSIALLEDRFPLTKGPNEALANTNPGLSYSRPENDRDAGFTQVPAQP